MPQSADRIDPCGPANGDIAGQTRRGYQRDTDGRERRHVSRADSEQEGGEHACQGERERHADGNTDRGHRQPFTHNHGEDIAALRAHRDADAISCVRRFTE